MEKLVVRARGSSNVLTAVKLDAEDGDHAWNVVGAWEGSTLVAAEAHTLGTDAGLGDLEALSSLELAAEALALVGSTALELADTADLAAARCEELEVVDGLSFEGLN